MGTFDSYADSPFQIKTEGEEITITLAKTSDTTARISWNIPPGAQGCASSNTVYCGMLVVLHTSPIRPPIQPVDGQQYVADKTADSNLHMGSKINDALVVGVFYNEKDLEQKTTFVDITDLKNDTPYYVAGFAVDCQFRYHTNGVRAYSAQYGNPDEASYNGTQLIGLGGVQSESVGGFDTQTTTIKKTYFGINASDATSLVLGTNYYFDMKLCEDDKTYRIVINGSDAQTYQELINALNKQFALLTSPLLGPSPPYTGIYYWDNTNQILYLWDGTNLVQQTVVIQDTDPTIRNLGDYWYDTSTGKVYLWDGSPSAWVEQIVIEQTQDPAQPDCDSYWYNPSTSPAIMRRYNGNVWCDLITYNSGTDPTEQCSLKCGTYWLDTDDVVLYEWNVEHSSWTQVSAIDSIIAPTLLPINSIWIKDGSPHEAFFKTASGPGSWGLITNIVFTDVEPVVPYAGLYWYDTPNETLYLRNATNTDWIDVEASGTIVVVWSVDPSDPASCDLWYNPSSEILYHWDTDLNDWNSVPSDLFYKQTTDPATPLVNVDDIWYDTILNRAYSWDGQMWVEIEFTPLATNPATPTTGTIWKTGGSPAWFVWNGTTWVAIDPIISATDPNTLPVGTFWFDTSSNSLFQWNGMSWVSISYVTSPPIPAKNTLWFDTVNMILYQWNGSEWVVAVLPVRASLETNKSLWDDRNVEAENIISNDTNSILLLTTGSAGSGICVEVDSNTDILFKSLEPAGFIEEPSHGRDGVPGVPTYMTNCGDDGSPDERRAFIDRLRRRLGYPTVQVELTKEDWNDVVDIALESLRLHSSAGYRRKFFFLFAKPLQQGYKLTNELTFEGKQLGYQCIVDVLEIRRMTSAFLSTAYGAGVYGQIIIQQLYSHGTFDLTSYHLVSEYIEQLEQLFASRMVFTWHEETRDLWLHQTLSRDEIMLLDTAVERTEQDLFKDRWVTRWLQERAMVEARLKLSEIRGKFGSLPGAGGGISLNAGDLAGRADADRERLYQQLDEYVADRPEEWGIGTTFTIG